ncbi:MAG TPA: pirin family protein [Thermoplasmata archaeon]|nr:pirin family protein [Thermoplasmata archaeon]
MTDTVRRVDHVFRGSDTLEGAGVRLHRAFGNREVPALDPFLLLDNFRSSDPADYVAGFPWHPHRGIETVTYMLDGRVEHGDSLGNQGAIDTGDVQWMSAGSGILHQEMPQRKEGLLHGFQLWVNLPAREKMSVPAYRGLTAGEIPTVDSAAGNRVKVVAGEFEKVRGPVEGIPVDPTYLDVSVPAGGEFVHPTPRGHTAFAYTVDGSGRFDPDRADLVPRGQAVLYGDGESVRIRAGDEGVRLLFVTGRPLHEPVSWYGPIVMNTPDEIRTAAVELQRGDFIKHRKVVVEE